MKLSPGFWIIIINYDYRKITGKIVFGNKKFNHHHLSIVAWGWVLCGWKSIIFILNYHSILKLINSWPRNGTGGWFDNGWEWSSRGDDKISLKVAEVYFAERGA